MEVKRFTKRPVPVEAVRFTGDNAAEIRSWQDAHRANPPGYDPPSLFETAAEAAAPDGPDDPDAYVWDHLHRTWVGTYVGQWVMRGTEGEHYPCADDGTGEAPMNYQEAPRG